MSKKKQRAN